MEIVHDPDRRHDRRHDHPPGEPRTTPEAAASAYEARVVAAESLTAVGPTALDHPPVVLANPDAINAYVDLAVHDAASPGFDSCSPQPVRPSAGLVTQSALTPLVRLGERFAAFHAHHVAGLLGQVVPETVTPGQVLRGLAHYILIGALVLGGAITVEVVYGSAAADLLARSSHTVSLIAAVAATVVLNGGAWFFADIAHRSHPHLARRRGLAVAIVGFLGIAVVVTFLGLVIGGWDPMQVTTVSGGGASTTADLGVDHRWLLAATYVALVLLATLVTAVGHYLVLDTYQKRFVHRTKVNEQEAKEASLTPAQQRALAARLARAHLDAIATAEQHIRLRLEAYNAAFSRHTGPELNDRMQPLAYDPVVPLWAAQAQHLADGRTDEGGSWRTSA